MEDITKMLEKQAAKTGKVLAIGHRGALGHAPENTMASLEKGVQLGCDLVEVDIHMSRDGELVVMHDPNVARTTNGRGRLKDMTLAEIKELDAGGWFSPDFRGERVPTLDEVLAWAKNRIDLVIEIKGDPLPAPGIEEKLVGKLHAFDMVDHVDVISFHHTSVRRVKELDSDITTGILIVGGLVDPVAAARAALADSVRPNKEHLTPEAVRQLHDAGLMCHAWVVNDEATLEYLVKMGIDSFGVDFPDRVRPYLDRTGRSWKH